MDTEAIKEYCLKELPCISDKGLWLDIYYKLLKIEGVSYVQARADFNKQKSQQLKFVFDQFEPDPF
jgi:hypothetical protein